MKSGVKLIALLLLLPILLSTVSCTEDNGGINAGDLLALSFKNIVFETLNESKTIEVFSVSDIAAEDITWTTTDPSVAICADGVVISKGYGVCVVRATAVGGATSSCVISVIDPYLTINFSDVEHRFQGIGDQYTISATNHEGHPINTIVTWSSSNHSIAVCEKGVIKATGYGICTVRAVASNGAFATCAVTVVDPNAPTIELGLPEGEEQIRFETVGEEFMLSADTYPLENTPVEWMSSDESVAVCENGLIRSVGEGVCAIVARSADGGSAACVVNVGNYPVGNTPPEDIMTYKILNTSTTLRYIDKRTGEVITEFIILSYTLEWEIVDGVLVITPYYHGLKTYDKDGLDGTNAVKAEFSLYAKNDKHCETKSYRVFDAKVGDTFTIKGDRFGVAILKSEVRPFYTTVSIVSD